MANNRFQFKRTSTSGLLPNTTNSANNSYIAAGEFAVNLTDKKVVSSNGTATFEVGANLNSLYTTGNITLANNNTRLIFSANSSAAGNISFITLQDDNNFVFYNTATDGSARPIWSIFTNSNTAPFNVLAPTRFNSVVQDATGSNGVNGYVLTSNGTAVNWAPAGSTSGLAAGNGLGSNTTHYFVRANTGIIANTTGTYVDPTYIATLDANNTTYLGGVNLTTIQSQITGNAATAYTNATVFASDASNINTGTLAVARLPANVVFWSNTNTFTANQTFNASAITSGNATSFFAAGTGTANGKINATAMAITVNATASAFVNSTAHSTTNGTAYSNVTVAGFQTSAGSVNLGNTAANTVANSTFVTLNANAASKLFVNTTAMFIGNSTVYSLANSSALVQVGTPTSVTMNTSSFYLSNGSFFAIVDTSSIRTSAIPLLIGNTAANAVVNTTQITLSTNSTVYSFINATSFSGTANDSLNLSGTSLGTIQTQITGNSATAYSNAVTTAATDASTKAGTAYSNAVATSSADATSKAATAYSNAVATAATDASSKAATAYSNAVATAASDATTKSGTAYSNAVATAASDATTKAGTAYTNAIAFASNASNINTGTLAFARLPANAVFWSNTNTFTAPQTFNANVTIAGNTTAQLTVGTAADGIDVNSSAISVGNATVFTTINSTSFSGTANNSTNLGGSSLATVQGQITGNAATAYTNAVATAASDATTKAGTAYTNATVFASNASNINTGTLAEARLPYRMDQNVATTSSVQFTNMYLTGNLTIGSNVNVIGANNYSVTDNMIYLNANATYANPDVGFTAGYSNGTYAHAGFFRDHTTGIWKVFDGYTPEPDADIYIDQTNSSFRTASFMANVYYVGNNTVYATVNSTIYSGTANNATNLGGSSLSTIQSQITGNAATAYTNAVATAASDATTKAGTAYSNAVATAATDASTKAGTAYSNAIAVAANATNLTSGTVNPARLGSGTANSTTVLYGNGVWAAVAAGINTAAAYTWTNTQSFSNAGLTLDNGTASRVFVGNSTDSTTMAQYSFTARGISNTFVTMSSTTVGIQGTTTNSSFTSSDLTFSNATHYTQISPLGITQNSPGGGFINFSNTAANSTLNDTSLKFNANAAANSRFTPTVLSISNATATATVNTSVFQTTSGALFVGTTATTNAVVNTSGVFTYGNAINYVATTSANTTTIYGNSTVYTSINATSINGSGVKVNAAILGTGTANSTTVLYGNGVWAVPTGSSVSANTILSTGTGANQSFVLSTSTATSNDLIVTVNGLRYSPNNYQVTGSTLYLTAPANSEIVIQLAGGPAGSVGPAGQGNVVGPISSTNTAIVRFDGTTGKLIKDSGILIDDSNNLSVPGNITTGGTSTQIGNVATTATYTFGGGATASGNTKTVNIGTGGVSGATVTINYGASSATTTHTFNGAATFGETTSFTGAATFNGGVTSNGGVLSGTAGASVNMLRTITSAGGVNNVLIDTNLIRASTGTDWYTTTLRMQSKVDNVSFSYLDFIPSGNGGAFAIGTGTTERFRITTAGRYGFNTTSPGSELEIADIEGDNDCRITLRANSTTTSQFGCSSTQTFVDSVGARSIIFYTNGTSRFLIDGTSGVLNSQPTYNNTAAGSTVVVTSTGAIRRTSSSIKYKKDVEDLDLSLASHAIDSLRPVWYRSKNPEGDDKATWSHIGLIAEEVHEVEPRLVRYRTAEVVTDEDGNQVERELEVPEPEDVDYARLSVLLLAEIKELRARVAALEAKV